jgi:hypothetical protein
MLGCSRAIFMDLLIFRIPPQMEALLSKYESRVSSICIFYVIVSCDYLPHRESSALGCSPPNIGKYDTSQRNDSVLIWSRIGCVSTTRFYMTIRRVTCVWTTSFGSWSEEGGQVHESSERDHNGQANIWQLYTTTIVCQVKQSWRQQDRFLFK